MIKSKEIAIIKDSDLTEDEFKEYSANTRLLANEMGVDLQKKRDRNAGEVKSMAMAFTKGFHYFISDDCKARVQLKNIYKISMDHI